MFISENAVHNLHTNYTALNLYTRLYHSVVEFFSMIGQITAALEVVPAVSAVSMFILIRLLNALWFL